MKPSHNASHGYILVLTLIILSIMVIMVTQLFNKGRTHLYFSKVMIEREQAKQIALGGLQLAMNQLAVNPEKNDEQKTEEKSDEKKEKQDPNILFLKKNLATLNLWQEYRLSEDIEGIDGTVKFCIMSENGKLDINKIFDFTTKKFLHEGAAQGDMKKAVSALFASAKKFLNNKDLFEAFEKFLKQRQYKVHDVTELLAIEDFQKVFKDKVFYEPPTAEKKEQRPVYLTDIFTISSDQPEMNAWLLSDSIRALFALKRSEISEQGQRSIEQLLSTIKSVSGDLKTVWETSLEKLYSKELKAVSNDLTILLSAKFRATLFSVLSYGTVGKITQKVFALIEVQEPGKFLVKKLYWL